MFLRRSYIALLALSLGVHDCASVNPQQYKIEYRKQLRNDDCGHTCLDMLGYDGHGMFKDPVDPDSLKYMEGVREIAINDTSHSNMPRMILFYGKSVIRIYRHWAIRYRGDVYCPLFGKIRFEDYEKAFIRNIEREFIVPFNSKKK
jgi:hypothetical protein